MEGRAMASVRTLIHAAAAAITISSSTAFAADLAPPVAYQPVVIEQGAWYLRGDIGVGILDKADFVFQGNPANNPVPIVSQHSSLGDTNFFDLGVGYEWNSWLRFDVTAEYRTKSSFNGVIMYNGAPTGVAGDQYTGFLQSDIFLANTYIDLGTWNCLTPFIGFGIGAAYNIWDNLFDTGIDTNGSGEGTNTGKVNFAWAARAGLAYAVTKNFTMELSYRFLSYGSVSEQVNCLGGCNPDTYKLTNLSSNDFMFGMRWRFPVESVPIVSQPAPPLYQPAPPPPPQYPLSTRG
jgi:opacity protein-like surface antigen